MDLFYFPFYLLIFLIFCYSLSRIFLWLLYYYLRLKFQINLQVKSIRFNSLRTIQLACPSFGINIIIEHLGLSSKLFNSKYNSLFVLKFSDIRLEGDIAAALLKLRSATLANNSDQAQSNDVTPRNNEETIVHQFLRTFFINKLSILAKKTFYLCSNYVSSNFQISLHNISLMQLGVPSRDYRINDCLLHSTIQLIQFGFAKSQNLITFQVDGFAIKVLKSQTSIVSTTDENDGGSKKSCLFQCSFPFRFVYSPGDQSAEMLISSCEIIVYDLLKLAKMAPKRMNRIEMGSLSKAKILEKLMITFHTILKGSLFKNASFKLNSATVKLVRESGKKDLTFSVEPIELSVNKLDDYRLEFNLSIANCIVQDSESIVDFSLNKCKTVCTIERDKLTDKLYIQLFLEIHNCSFIINIDYLINYWFQHYFVQSFPNDQNGKINSPVGELSHEEVAAKYINKFLFLMVIHDISLSLKHSENFGMVTYGLKHLKITCVRNVNLFRETCVELLLETFWCWNGNIQLKPLNPNSLKKYNEKHVPLFMSTLLLKFSNMNSSDLRINCVMDGLQVSLEYYLNTLETFNLESLKNTISIKDGSISSTSSNPFHSPYVLLGQINFTSVNVFTRQLMMRIDSMACDLNGVKITTSINGFGINSMYAPSATLACLKASELIQHRIVYFSVMRINFSQDNGHDIALSLTEEIFIQWCPLFHVNVLELWEDFHHIYLNFKPDIQSHSSPVIANNDDDLSIDAKPYSLSLKLDGKICLGILLSDDSDTMRFETDYFTIAYQSQNQSMTTKCELLNIFINDVLNCKLEHLLIGHLPAAKSYLDRRSFKLTKKEQNDAIEIIVDKVTLKFPYQFNFAYYFNEKFLTIIKWLRLFHSKPKQTQPESPSIDQDSLLSPDFIIKIQSILMELDDDPFEIRLNNNYELMEDEYNESLKRWNILMEKINEKSGGRNNPSLYLTDDLCRAFDRQNAKTYVERSKKMYDANQTVQRTQLFTVKMENFQLHLIADSSYDSYEKKIRLLKQIDFHSPVPEDLRFSTIWCRQLFASIGVCIISLRDFPQPMLNAKKLYFKGVLLGAEQEASARARRTCEIDMGPNFARFKIERSMTTMKFYHDIISNISSLIYTHGACWEPILQQVNLSFELIFRPSNDPSPSLTWWDKLRFLFHGSLKMNSKQISIVFHASLDPYNSTELIEFSFVNSTTQIDNGRIQILCDLDVFVHAASKYDECRIIHLPDVTITFNLNWDCSGNKNDHHSVMPCAQDKLPEYTCNQVHDSYRAFRSHHLNLSASIETKDNPNSNDDQMDPTSDRIPCILIYNSTLRWLENKKFMITGFPRLTRRGKLYKNTRPRKMPFTRLFKSIRLTIYLQKLEVTYWSSFNRNRGFKIQSSNLSHSAQHGQTFIKINDNLIHRPKPLWETMYMNSELSHVDIELYKAQGSGSVSLLNVQKVTYNRETKLPQTVQIEDGPSPTHRVVVHDLKGAWTKDNRDIVISLFDSYFKTLLLKRNLSTEALRLFKDQLNGTPSKNSSHSDYHHSHHHHHQQNHQQSSPYVLSKGNAANMLQKLISESESCENIVDTEQIEKGINDRQQLYGIEACQGDDVLLDNWLIELVNSQVVLRGCETDGYVIVSAAKAQIMQRIHRPVWKNRILYSKTTWQGSLECMQYYATVDAGGLKIYQITWLDLNDIEEPVDKEIAEIPDLVGSGRSVGGVVNSEAGGSTCTESINTVPIQLQRIVSRCQCKFFYASYGENTDPNNYEAVPPLPQDDDLLPLEPWDREVAVDTFTITHDNLEIFTNSQQYAMIMDLVNNLLLYVEPHKKEIFEKQQRIRFSMQLNSLEEQREPISELQEKVRSLLNKIKLLEKESFILYKKINQSQHHHQDDWIEFQEIEAELEKCKRELNVESENLSIMINCYKEAQLIAMKTKERQVAAQESRVPFMAQVIRRNEVCFRQARWRLTDSDGQLGLADLELNNFLYTKVSKNDDSVEHSFELGYIRVQNMIPNQAYRDVLQPTELQPNMPVDRNRALRILCIERAPVGGIAVKEHLEVNFIPLTVGLTYAFFKKMLKFFFPDRNSDTVSITTTASSSQQDSNDTMVPDTDSLSVISSSTSMSSSKTKTKKNSAHHLKRDESMASLTTSLSSYNFPMINNSKMVKEITHIEKMRERASKNQTFVYIKIPEVPIKISYKGNKNKNLEDLHDFNLLIPTIEYHNRTWTWLDLLMALKSDSKRVLLSQALKHKFHISKSKPLSEPEKKPSQVANNQNTEDEDKARILLGNIVVPQQKNSRTKSLLLFGGKK
ncbi:bridge-like lipid transfer protein family member hobbit [Dermatophagoides pteronyssinus]|uniref:bridge-like lipid transfer protein family member hobbit n=1 Tax=Dermatophagoides pteronyssinus TaxID=6956 RepID=UPI003F670545